MAKQTAERHGRLRPKRTSAPRKASAGARVAAAPDDLPHIVLVGPNLLDANGQPNPNSYLWSANLAAPYTRRGDPIGQNFPVRPLAVDTGTVEVTYGHYIPPRKSDFQPPPALHAAVRADDGDNLTLTVGLPQSDKSGAITTGGGQEVVAAPIDRFDKTQSDWPPQPIDAIRMPVLRLVDGRVSVAISNRGGPLFKLFVGLGLKPTGRGRSASITMDLTPLGFEFDASIRLPFANAAGPDPVDVEGRFSLTHERIGIWGNDKPSTVTQLCLRKVADDDAAAAWSDITLRLAKSNAGAWSSIETRAGAHPPALRWAVGLDAQQNLQIDNTLLDLSPDAFTFIFSSSAGPALRTRRPDGVAVLAPECLQMKFLARPSQIALRAFCLPADPGHASAPAPPGLEYKYDGQTQTEIIKIASPTLNYQPRQFAQSLRNFYGIMPPDPATTSGTATAPWWLWAFTPVERGWVQFPVPNIPPPNPDNDAERIASLPSEVGGGAFTGFARFSNRQEGAEPIPTVAGGSGKPPWSVSLDRADAFRGTWTLDAVAAYVPSAIQIDFDAPQVFCRGLIWISADAPGPQEALPRLSAGPGSLVDIAFDIGSSSGDDASGLVFSLDGALTVKLDGPAASPTLGYDGISAGFPADAPDLPDVPPEIADVLGVSSATGTWKDLRAIAWMRHPNIPLVAEMPMTRASGSDSGPLESRDFAPYRCETFGADNRLFQVRHDAGAFWNTLVETLGRDGRLRRLGAWPWSQAPSVARKPARATRAAASDPLEQIVGIAFAPVGVPGVETQPTEAVASSWDNAGFAYRYDIALLDEAYATAEPPPVAPQPPPANQRPPPPPPRKPVATALDLAALAEFWKDQRVRHSLSRVQASYAFGWGGRKSRDVNVANLVQPYIWQTKAAFSDATDLGAVTIGPSANGPLVDAFGSAALLGLSTSFKINGQYLAIDPNGPISVTGWSPATYDTNGLTADMRGFAAESAPRATGLLVRTVQNIGVDPSPSRLVTARKPYRVGLYGNESLAFWFRDLPVTKAGRRPASWIYQTRYQPSIDLDDATRNWLREQLPFAGFEWRLGYHIEQGLWWDALPFFGLYLTPLRLVEVRFSDDQGEPGSSIQSVKIICRLDLTRPPHDSTQLANLVQLTLDAVPGPDLVVRQISGYSAKDGSSPDKPLCWPVDCSISVLGTAASRGVFADDNTLPVTGYLYVTPDETRPPGGNGIHFKSAALELPFLGTRWSIGLGPFDLPPDATHIAFTSANPRPSDVYVEAAQIDLQPKDHTVAINFDLAVRAGGSEPYALRFAGGTFYWLGAPWLSGAMSTVAAPRPVLHFDHDHAAVTIRFKDFNFGSAKPAQLFRGFPLTGFTASATLAFSVTPSAQDMKARGPVAGLPRFDIVAAYGEVQADSNDLRLRHVIEKREREEEAALRMRALDAPSDGTWIADLRFSGTIAKASWINWPVVDVDPIDPKRGDQAADSDRVVVTFTPSGAATHEVSFMFADHRVPTKNLVVDPNSHVVSLGAPWNTYVLAVHKIRRGLDMLTWSGIQAVTIEDLDGIVAEAASAGDKTTVLATRYRNPDNAHRGRYRDDPYMLHPGLAIWRFGLRGRHGSAFLKKIFAAYAANRRPRDAPVLSLAHALVVSSSHLGVFTPQADSPDERRLLEMPFFADLFGIDGKALVFDQPLPTAGRSEIAWFDWPTNRAPTPTARDIVAVDPVHQVDAQSLEGLLKPKSVDGSPIKLDGLFSVEQYFAKPDIFSADNSAEPIWLRALLALNALWKEAQVPHVEGTPLESHPISLVPTIAAETDKDGTIERRYAVMLLRVGAAKGNGSNGSPPRVTGELIVCEGKILRRTKLADWIATSLAENVDEHPDPNVEAAVATTCAALAAQASFALVRYSDADNPGDYVVAPVALEMLRGRELFVPRQPLRPPADRLYESPNRGWPLPARAAMEGLGGVWVTGVASGAIAPIRDDKSDPRIPERPDPSGVAGLATRFTAIAYSAEPAKNDSLGPIAGSDVLWLADRSVPAFRAPIAVTEPSRSAAADALPLATPPIDWLTPHPPRARVPTKQAIGAIVADVRQPNAGRDGSNPFVGLAPMLPSRFGEAVVGERAGIVYARRTSLIVREADAYALDEREPRFGAAGGHGTSIVRQVRTPRPGPIPHNVGDRGRDRRTFIWDGEFARMCRLVRGSVNVVRGDRADQPWIVSIGAETATNGVVSDISNGRATLTFEIVSRAPDDGIPPAVFVWKYLLTRKTGDSSQISAAARLTVGAQTFVYRSIALSETSPWNSVGGSGRGFCRFAVDVDPAQQADVQTALAGLPPGAPVVISLTVENDALASTMDLPQDWPKPLANDPAAGMKSGRRRPAVALDLPLAVVSRSRLALPLVPTTLVFADPAYDAVATTTAFQTRGTFSPTIGGPMTIALAADREPYHPSESVGFMFDVRMEKRVDGAWVPVDLSNVSFDVTLRRIPRGKPAVKLNFGDTSVGKAGSIEAGHAYSFAIGALRDDKGQPVAFDWSDLLEIAVAIDPKTPSDPTKPIIAYLKTTTHPPLQLRIVEKPTLAPPESLYAVLARTPAGGGGYRVEAPLVAQSPRADRLDFVDLVEDLRGGLVRRRAQWLWHMARPVAELVEGKANASLVETYLVKADRNGQMQLPDRLEEFVRPEALGSWPPSSPSD